MCFQESKQGPKKVTPESPKKFTGEIKLLYSPGVLPRISAGSFSEGIQDTKERKTLCLSLSLSCCVCVLSKGEMQRPSLTGSLPHGLSRAKRLQFVLGSDQQLQGFCACLNFTSLSVASFSWSGESYRPLTPILSKSLAILQQFPRVTSIGSLPRRIGETLQSPW